ncbi:MAG: hypothetical protein ABF289_04130 [Clostridiales bacterium]
MKVKFMSVTIIIFAVIFGSIGITSVLGIWKTENTKEPAKYKEGEFKGEYNPADIRGSYTFGEISDLFDVPISDLSKAFALKDEDESFKCKELEMIYEQSALNGKEVGTDSVRIFVALYNSLPITLNNSTYFPNPAVNILKNKVSIKDKELEYIESHKVESIEIIESDKDINSSEENEEFKVKGTTIFKELLDEGIKKEEIEKILDGKITDDTLVIKDYCSENGIEFSSIKTKLEELKK